MNNRVEIVNASERNDRAASCLSTLQSLPGLRILACFVLILATTPSPAAEATTEAPNNAKPEAKEDQEVTQAKHLFPSAEEVGGSRLVQQRDAYLAERKWVLGYSPANPGSAYLGWGEASIQAKPDDLDYGQSRVLAYETALMDAMGSFVRFQQRLTTTETIRTLFQDSGNLAEEDVATESARLKTIWQKILALTEAELDRLLEKSGVDPAQFRSKPLEERRKQLQDSVQRTVKVRALGSVAGVRTLATFEDLNAVGVLIVYSDKQRELAKSMLSGQTVARSESSTQGQDLQRQNILRQIEAACPNGAADLAHIFGVRVMTDEHGDRVLVSFGQWSPAITRLNSQFRRETEIKAARAKAMNLADGALTDFVNSTLALESESTLWQAAELTRILSPTPGQEEESRTIGETLNNLLKAHGKATLRGVVTLKEWTANHPETGHLLVGHILMWSPTSRDAAIHGLRPPAAHKSGSDQPRIYENKVRTSPDFDKDADF